MNANTKIYRLILLRLAACLLAYPLYSQSFSEFPAPGLLPLQASKSGWADFDNDGFLDILTTGTDSTGTVHTCLYLNQSGKTFLKKATGIVAMKQASLSLADFNNDMFVDVLITGLDQQGKPVATIYANQGKLTFTDVQANLPPLTESIALWIDLDNDGKKDVLMSGLGTDGKPATRLFRNKGTAFVEVKTTLPGFSKGSIVWLDENLDGRLDLLLTGLDGTHTPTSKLYQNQGKFQFKALAANLEPLASGSAAAGDYNSDGSTDLLMTGIGRDGKAITRLYLKETTGFAAASFNLAPMSSGSATLADLDSDGRTDIFLTGLNAQGQPSSHFYRNAADGSVEEVALPFAGGSVALGDFDGDGNPDALRTGLATTGAVIGLYRNGSLRKNTGAKPPLTADVMPAGDRAIFSWSTGADDATSPTTLTYDVFVSTDSTLMNVKAFEYSAVKPLRRIVAHGSQGQATTYTIEGLPDGEYYWGIISVDNAFQTTTQNGICRGRKFRICHQITQKDTTVCKNATLALSVGQPANWYSARQGLLATGVNLNYLVTEDDTLYAVADPLGSCAQRFSMIVHPSPLPRPQVGNDTTVCANSLLELRAGPGWKKVDWYASEKGLIQSAATIQYRVTEKTVLWAQVTDSQGCIGSDTMQVNVFPTPSVTPDNISINAGESVTLSASGGGTYRWTPATDLSNPRIANPVASPKSSTTYRVTITTVNGCEVTDSVRITVNTRVTTGTMFIPTLFTPNGDGNNDQFKVYGEGIGQLTLQVYDRSGSLLYQTSDVNAATSLGWDGYTHGSPQPNGTYLWTIRGTFSDGKEIEYKGKKSGIINLMR